MNKTCERCHNPINGDDYQAFLDNDHEYLHICYSCAVSCYNDGWDITEPGGWDSLYLCCSCSEFFTERELRVVDGGEFECPACIDGDLSHGGSTTVHYGDVDIEEIRKQNSYVKATPRDLAEVICGELNFGYMGWDPDTGVLDVYSDRAVAVNNTVDFIKKKFGGN